MKKILITGGAGFIGSHVVHSFVTNYPGVIFLIWMQRMPEFKT
jgi:nucleoside-diphosphate-sugar epimerase